MLICTDENPVSVTPCAAAHYHSLIEKSGYSILTFNPLTLSCHESSVPALTHWSLHPELFPVVTGKYEQSHQVSAFGTFAPDYPFESPILRSGVMLDG